MSISPRVQVVQVMTDDDPPVRLREHWEAWVAGPARAAQREVPQLVELESRFRQMVNPIIEHLGRLQRAAPDSRIAVLLPALHGPHWYHQLLNNHRAELLETRLLLESRPEISVIITPWNLGE